jgi:hypothetical protein
VLSGAVLMNCCCVYFYEQIALAAERGRLFVKNLLGLSIVKSVGSTSNVWNMVQKYSSSLLR